MKRIGLYGLLLSLVVGAGGAYVASPFYAVWTLREALRTADTETIRRKIDFEGVRASLRQSIAASADLLPEMRSAGRAIRPTLWQRVKRAFGASLIDRYLETNITPEGLPKLYAKREARRQQTRDYRDGHLRHVDWQKGGIDVKQKDWRDQLRAFVRRIERAQFLSATTVEIELADVNNERRSFVARLDLRGIEWTLTSVRVQARPSPGAPPEAEEPLGLLADADPSSHGNEVSKTVATAGFAGAAGLRAVPPGQPRWTAERERADLKRRRTASAFYQRMRARAKPAWARK